MVKKNSF